MTNKKALFVGCSFTANCGFNEQNQNKYHWPHIFCQQTGHLIVNRAIGGMSNHEIFSRTVEAISNYSYNLVVVMWSEVSRYWTYCSEHNVDDFTILLPSNKGLMSDRDFVKSYAQMHRAYFNNEYVKTKHWLLYCIALENCLKNQNIDFVFIKGFSNYVNDFNNVTYDSGFTGVDKIKKLLNFDQRPDDYILKKINEIKNLIQAQDDTRWLNLHGLSFKDMTVDLADDNMHPGPKSNLMLADTLINFYKNI
jgi:hypothetical protein